MGLDNFIIVKHKKCPPNCEPFAEGQYVIAYWRKCWNIRNEIVNKIHAYDGGDTRLGIEEIIAIKEIVKKYLKKDYWDENDDSIWSYDDMFESNLKAYVNLCWLERHIKDKHTEAFFIDSY